MSSCEAIITAIFSCYNYSFQTNEVPLFNVESFNISLFEGVLFGCMYYFYVTLVAVGLLNLNYFNLLLFNAALFYMLHCINVALVYNALLTLRYLNLALFTVTPFNAVLC